MSPEKKSTVLTDDERWWASHYEFLADNGYTLRPRYAPNWVPSWEGTTTEWYNAEDGQPAISAHTTIDAIGPKGNPVCLKRTNRRHHPNEEAIGTFLSSGERSKNRKNHCVPVLEVLPVLKDGDESILVMPLLRRFADPEFDTVGEVVDFLQQIFEGLSFMHDNGVAHLDCTSTNIMIDATAMYPESWHPQQPVLKPDYTGRAKHFRRTERPPTYYWVDFAHAQSFTDMRPVVHPMEIHTSKATPEIRLAHADAAAKAKARARGEVVEEVEVDPNWEAHGGGPIGPHVDPFAVDVYCLGMFVMRTFVEPVKNMSFLVSLIDDMVADDPTLRPGSDIAARRLRQICSTTRTSVMREPLVPSDKAARKAQKTWPAISHWARRLKYIFTRTPAVPTRPIPV